MSNNDKVILVNLDHGFGSAIVPGYKKAYDLNYDIGVVMPGDAQALPKDFDNLVAPIIDNSPDYTKGNKTKIQGCFKDNAETSLNLETRFLLVVKFA